jgi:hypothetical protein
MLKTLSAVTLAVMLVAGTCGMASASCSSICCSVDCETDISLDKDIDGTVEVDVGATIDMVDLYDKNVSDICQDGDNNFVGGVTQFGMTNYSEVCQDGNLHDVGTIYQDSFLNIGGNVSVVVQFGGDDNNVGWIDQRTPNPGYNVSSVVQDGDSNIVGNIWQST